MTSKVWVVLQRVALIFLSALSEANLVDHCSSSVFILTFVTDFTKALEAFSSSQL